MRSGRSFQKNFIELDQESTFFKQSSTMKTTRSQPQMKRLRGTTRHNTKKTWHLLVVSQTYDKRTVALTT